MAKKKLLDIEHITNLNGTEEIVLIDRSNGKIVLHKVQSFIATIKDSIKIGIRNLVLGTSREPQVQSGDNYWVRTYMLSEQPFAGQWYTLSFKDLQLPNSTGHAENIYLWSGSWDTSIILALNIQEGDSQYTFQVPENISGTYQLRFYRPNVSGFSVREVKLELGNIATPWWPAVEEMINP